ncbi:OLC1v1013490C1 [Oldenlandia corymbosa var. corymbosa]|uniref:OLC1v1013490C1 n=1 Tax=Oldenlandia corymbosa var. corymbosa TaxID=529605 RepID=A0AAV1E1N1_OLDCO|nr:OLC1v1013490C1 [Oldenlandia corymbosa var. corymbosa]
MHVRFEPGWLIQFVVVANYVVRAIIFDDKGCHVTRSIEDIFPHLDLRFCHEIKEDSYDSAMVYPSIIPIFHITDPYIAIRFLSKEYTWRFEIVKKHGAIIGFSGVDWKDFYKTVHLEIGNHLVFVFQVGNKFGLSVFGAEGIMSFQLTTLSNLMNPMQIPVYLIVKHRLMEYEDVIILYKGKITHMSMQHGCEKIGFGDVLVKPIHITGDWQGFLEKYNLQVGHMLMFNVYLKNSETDGTLVLMPDPISTVDMLD